MKGGRSTPPPPTLRSLEAFMGVASIRLKPLLYSWKIVCNTMLYVVFSMAENRFYSSGYSTKNEKHSPPQKKNLPKK